MTLHRPFRHRLRRPAPSAPPLGQVIARSEEQAHEWFAQLIGPQLRRHRAALAAARPLMGTLAYDEAKRAADDEWDRTTFDAHRVYRLALADLLATGGISEATAAAYNECAIRQIMQEAA